ncbi:MAG TPA: methyltransferase [Polyangiaceae bacterium]|nr:methyltransferase [Polyangiaceae bacterium]
MSPASTLPAEIEAWLRDPGFTPGAKHFAKLFAALEQADREDARKLERVLGRGGEAAGRLACERVAGAEARTRARLIGVLGRVASASPASESVPTLLRSLEDTDERVRRVASLALGKLALPELEGRLLTRWAAAQDLERRSLAEALGKCGAERSLALLADLRTSDSELQRIAERSRLMIERDTARVLPSSIALDRPLGAPQSVLVHCRSGLAWVLAEEARAHGAVTVVAPDRVRLTHRGTFAELLQLRTALDFGVEVPLTGNPGDRLETRILGALEQPDAERGVRAWTAGRARFRLAFSEGGHQRDKVWKVAAAITARLTWFHNDPHDSTWEVVVDSERNVLELRPRRFEDPRFFYRAKDVPAASHPTLAAALARVAGARADDIVWDPFVGSGLELIERALLGPYRELHGTDLDAQALLAARANAERAQLKNIFLHSGDARRHRVPGVSLVISNPPMGRRVARDGNLGSLLDDFVQHAGASLVAGGRLVWLSPLPERTATAARRCGFRVTRHESVDMGGFGAELQRFDR